MPGMTGIEKAVEKAGNSTKLANLVGSYRQQVDYWVKTGHVPGEHCPAVWRATGVPLYELNPAIYPREAMAN